MRLELTIPRLEGECVIQLRQQDKKREINKVYIDPSWVRTNDLTVNSRTL